MEFNKKNIKTFILIAFACILFYLGIKNIGLVVEAIGGVLGIMFPFILGAGIAFVINVPMTRIEFWTAAAFFFAHTGSGHRRHHHRHVHHRSADCRNHDEYCQGTAWRHQYGAGLDFFQDELLEGAAEFGRTAFRRLD